MRAGPWGLPKRTGDPGGAVSKAMETSRSWSPAAAAQGPAGGAAPGGGHEGQVWEGWGESEESQRVLAGRQMSAGGR